VVPYRCHVHASFVRHLMISQFVLLGRSRESHLETALSLSAYDALSSNVRLIGIERRSTPFCILHVPLFVFEMGPFSYLFFEARGVGRASTSFRPARSEFTHGFATQSSELSLQPLAPTPNVLTGSLFSDERLKGRPVPLRASCLLPLQSDASVSVVLLALDAPPPTRPFQDLYYASVQRSPFSEHVRGVASPFF